MANTFYATSPRVGKSKNAYDIFTSKPGVGPIDYSLDDTSGFARSTTRRQTAFKAAGAQITSPRRQELPIGNHSSSLKRQQQRRKELSEDVVVKPGVGPVAMGIDTVPKDVLQKRLASLFSRLNAAQRELGLLLEHLERVAPQMAEAARRLALGLQQQVANLLVELGHPRDLAHVQRRERRVAAQRVEHRV